MGDLYDPNRESSYLQYLNTNNLYGWAMSQPLPSNKFKWVDIKPSQGEAVQTQISTLVASKIKGYLLEVDIKYPTDLHNSHNDLPFMCDKMKINKVEKLVPNLRDKKNSTFQCWIKCLGMGWYLRGFIELLSLIKRIG